MSNPSDPIKLNEDGKLDEDMYLDAIRYTLGQGLDVDEICHEYDKLILRPLLKVKSKCSKECGCEIVESSALGKKFLYCRTHKIEV